MSLIVKITLELAFRTNKSESMNVISFYWHTMMSEVRFLGGQISICDYLTFSQPNHMLQFATNHLNT